MKIRPVSEKVTGQLTIYLQYFILHSFNVRKKPFYVCFVDFKKAFDMVSHHILWCKLIRYGIEISQKKTKVLVFQKSSARSNRTQKIWSIGDILINEAKSYKYLGITIKVDGSFTEHVS